MPCSAFHLRQIYCGGRHSGGPALTTYRSMAAKDTASPTRTQREKQQAPLSLRSSSKR